MADRAMLYYNGRQVPLDESDLLSLATCVGLAQRSMESVIKPGARTQVEHAHDLLVRVGMLDPRALGQYQYPPNAIGRGS